MYKPALITGTLFAMLSVILGAFGAHALKAVLTPELLNSFETGVRYQLYHGLALLFAGLYAKPGVKAVTTCWISGVILFSGSIYLLVALKGTLQIGLGGLGLLTPIGGVLLIAGWASLLYALLRKN